MATKKTTPKSRALQRSARQARSATKRAKVYEAVYSPRITEAGVGWGNVVRAGAAVVSKLRGGSTKPRTTPSSRNNPFDLNKLRAEDDRRAIARAARSSARSKQVAREKGQAAKGPKYGTTTGAKKTVRVKPANATRKTTTVSGTAPRQGYTVGGREAYGQVNPAKRIARDTPRKKTIKQKVNEQKDAAKAARLRAQQAARPKSTGQKIPRTRSVRMKDPRPGYGGHSGWR